MNSDKGLPAVLREWAGSYEEGSFDTEAGLMIEAADAIEDMLAALRGLICEWPSMLMTEGQRAALEAAHEAIARAEGDAAS